MPLCLPGNTRLGRAIVCISVWFRSGLSRYIVEQLGASKPVIHIAQTNAIRSGSSGSLNFSSSFSRSSFACDEGRCRVRVSPFVRLRFVQAKRPPPCQWLLRIPSSRSPRASARILVSMVLLRMQWPLHPLALFLPKSAHLVVILSAVALSIDTTIALP